MSCWWECHNHSHVKSFRNDNAASIYPVALCLRRLGSDFPRNRGLHPATWYHMLSISRFVRSILNSGNSNAYAAGASVDFANAAGGESTTDAHLRANWDIPDGFCPPVPAGDLSCTLPTLLEASGTIPANASIRYRRGANCIT